MWRTTGRPCNCGASGPCNWSSVRRRRAAADDLDGAIADLAVAERYGAAPDVLAGARLRLADHVADDIRADLVAGEPDRVVERVDALAKQKVNGPALRRAREAAEAWQAGRGEARRGEFGRAGEQLDRAERLAGDAARSALAAARRDLEGRQQAAGPKVDRFYRTLSDQPDAWPAILSAAEDLLQVVPDHPAARQARSRAWQQIGAIGPASPGIGPRPSAAGADILFIDDNGRASTSPATCRPAPAPSPSSAPPVPRPRPKFGGPNGRMLLWADAIGGYLVCLDDEVTLGRAGPDGSADVPLLGDLARRHATIVRDGEHYTVRAEHPTFVNGKPIGTAPLRDGDVIRLGPTVELEFRRPSPVTSTATLKLLSRHRLPMAVDGVILMAQSCLLGRDPPVPHRGASAEAAGRPVPPGRRPLVPLPRGLRGRRQARPLAGPALGPLERPRRRILVQPRAARTPGPRGRLTTKRRRGRTTRPAAGTDRNTADGADRR